MLQRMSIAAFLGHLIRFVEDGTGLPCHVSPDGEESPFYSVTLLGSDPANTKTAFVDVFHVNLHCIAEPVEPYSPAPVLDLATRLEEAMTRPMALPAPFRLHNLEYKGLQALKEDETHEGHAVLAFDFHISYGLRCK